MKSYITEVEIYDEDIVIAKLNSFDSGAVKVEINEVFTSEEWKELSDEIYSKLKEMEV